MDDVALAKTRGVEDARGAPVIGPPPFRVVDRPGRGEDPRELAGRDGRKPAEGRRLALQLEKARLPRHRQVRQRAPVGDRLRVDMREDAGEAGGALLRERDDARQRGHERALAFFRVPRLEPVVVAAFRHLVAPVKQANACGGDNA